MRRALLVDDMRHVFIIEIFERGDDRVRCRSAEGAERRFLHRKCNVPDVGDIFNDGLAGGDLVHVVEELTSADTARSALPA